MLVALLLPAVQQAQEGCSSNAVQEQFEAVGDLALDNYLDTNPDLPASSQPSGTSFLQWLNSGRLWRDVVFGS